MSPVWCRILITKIDPITMYDKEQRVRLKVSDWNTSESLKNTSSMKNEAL